MHSALIIYATMSGNTEEVAELIADGLRKNNVEVNVFNIASYLYGISDLPNPRDYDAVFIGTYTWDHGSTPEEIKEVVADIGYKPANVFIFGTGDTQFGGDDLFCLATDKLARFYDSPTKPLKIEQSPRGTQESKVIEWVDVIINEEAD